jgi:hypothetical protein
MMPDVRAMAIRARKMRKSVIIGLVMASLVRMEATML